MVMYFKALLACIPSTYVSDMLVKWTSIWYGLIAVIFETLKKQHNMRGSSSSRIPHDYCYVFFIFNLIPLFSLFFITSEIK